MTSQAERRRRKQARVSLAGGQSVPQRPHSRDRTHTNQPEDAQKTAREARQRHTGITDPKEALQPLCGTDLGRCVVAITKGEERAKLEGTWDAISASRRNYLLLVIGQTGDPQGAAIAMVPERLETNQSLRVDLRTPDEKIAAAKASWLAWEAKINALHVPGVKWAMRGAIYGFMGEGALWRDRAPTAEGRMAVQALRELEK